MKFLPQLSELKKLRKQLGISQTDLAEELNIPQSSISRIETGRIDPPYSKVKLVYNFLIGKKIEKNKIKKTAENIMTEEIVSIGIESTITEAIELMNKHQISQLPILESNQNLGSLTAKRIQKYIAEHPDLSNISIEHLKELPFPEIQKSWKISTVSQLLTNYPAVLVKEFDKYIGIITDADFLKLA
ncbi:MAG: CBS domain-containing protein [Promethearchaeia archaeon]